MPQIGIFPWTRPMPHDHSVIGQGGLVDPTVIDHDALLNFTEAAHLPFLGCRAFLDVAGQVLTTALTTKVLFNAEDYDLGGDFDADGVDSDFIAPSDGYYLIDTCITFLLMPDQVECHVRIYKNGNRIIDMVGTPAHTGTFAIPSMTIEYLLENDVIDIRARHTAGIDKDVGHGRQVTYVNIFRVAI